MMRKMIMVYLFILSMIALAQESYIVLDKDENRKRILQKQETYQRIIQNDLSLHALVTPKKFQPVVKKVNNIHLLKVGPFTDDNLMAMVFLSIKPTFKDAFIMQRKEADFSVGPMVQTVEKIVYKEPLKSRTDNETGVWVALFILALVGIIYIFISSEQIKRLKREYERMRSKHDELEQRQSNALSNIGENIQIITQETVNHTESLAQKVKETPFYEDVEKMIYSERELLNVTGDLVKYLRIKSKKIVIQNQLFNFNHMLNEIAGLLHTKFRDNDIELIFDIDKEVPKDIFADSVHIAQILINLLEYFIQHSNDKEISLNVIALPLKDGVELQFKIDTDVYIEDKEKLFQTSYDEEAKRYVGLGLFIANELVWLMNGELLIEDNYRGSCLTFALPIQVKSKEKRKYRLPNKSLVAKRVLIVDKNQNAAKAAKKLFAYFKAEVTLMSEEAFLDHLPDFSEYEIVALCNRLFEVEVCHKLREVKQTQELKVILLDHLFSSEIINHCDEVDIHLTKPLTQEYIFDTLIELYDKEWLAKSLGGSGLRDRAKLQVHREMFKSKKRVTLEDFAHFKQGHILVVENNVMHQKAMMEMLIKTDLKLTVAHNGQEAIDLLSKENEHVDMILMDINIPVIDGYQTAEMIRKSHRFDETAIVFFTALPSEHEVEKMIACGMNGYLSKPVEMGALYTAMSQFIEHALPSSQSAETIQTTSVQFDGLNIEDGLSHVGNNVVFYRQVLQEFVSAYDTSDEIFERLVQEQRYGQINVFCRDMKAITSTIGAKTMNVLLNDIHQCILYKKPELVHSYVKQFKLELDKLLQSIETYLSF